MPDSITITLRPDQIPFLSDAFCYAIDAMTAEVMSGDPDDIADDLAGVQELRLDIWRQFHPIAREQDQEGAEHE